MFLELNNLLAVHGTDTSQSSPAENALSSLSGKSVLITQSSTDAGFVIHHLLSLYLKHNKNVCFVGIAQSFTHYNSIGNKLGVSLTKCRDSGNLAFIEAQKSLGQTITQPPPNATCCSMMQYYDSEFGKLKDLYEKVKTAMDNFSDMSRDTLVIVDDLTILVYLGFPVMDVVYLAQYLRQVACPTAESSGCLALLVRSDRKHQDEEASQLLHQLAHQCHLVLSVDGLPTGYCKDVHGELNVRWQAIQRGQSKQLTDKRMQYKITDKTVSFFALGTSAAVL